MSLKWVVSTSKINFHCKTKIKKLNKFKLETNCISVFLNFKGGLPNFHRCSRKLTCHYDCFCIFSNYPLLRLTLFCTLPMYSLFIFEVMPFELFTRCWHAFTSFAIKAHDSYTARVLVFWRPSCICGNVLAKICHEAAAVLCCDRLSAMVAVGAGSQLVVSCCVSSVLHVYARSWRKKMQAKLILI